MSKFFCCQIKRRSTRPRFSAKTCALFSTKLSSSRYYLSLSTWCCQGFVFVTARVGASGCCFSRFAGHKSPLPLQTFLPLNQPQPVPSPQNTNAVCFEMSVIIFPLFLDSIRRAGWKDFGLAGFWLWSILQAWHDRWNKDSHEQCWFGSANATMEGLGEWWEGGGTVSLYKHVSALQPFNAKHLDNNPFSIFSSQNFIPAGKTGWYLHLIALCTHCRETDSEHHGGKEP